MPDLELRTNLSDDFTSTRQAVKYPYIHIPKYGQEVALLMQCIVPGDLPIVLTHAGSLRRVGSCSLSAFELAKLLKVYKYEVVLSESERRAITTIQDIMEVLSWMVS